MKVWMRPRCARLDRLGAAVDVLELRARQPADHRILGAAGDLLHAVEIALAGDREAGLDDVDAHLVEQLGDLELLVEGHGGAGALLAVAQGRVEDDDAVASRARAAFGRYRLGAPSISSLNLGSQSSMTGKPVELSWIWLAIP